MHSEFWRGKISWNSHLKNIVRDGRIILRLLGNMRFEIVIAMTFYKKSAESQCFRVREYETRNQHETASRARPDIPTTAMGTSNRT
jgi:hypothetical protein